MLKCKYFFFNNLSAIPIFFKSSKKFDMLGEIVEHRLPKAATTRGNNKIGTINWVFEKQEKLIEMFKRLKMNASEEPQNFDIFVKNFKNKIETIDNNTEKTSHLTKWEREDNLPKSVFAKYVISLQMKDRSSYCGYLQTVQLINSKSVLKY